MVPYYNPKACWVRKASIYLKVLKASEFKASKKWQSKIAQKNYKKFSKSPMASLELSDKDRQTVVSETRSYACPASLKDTS